MTPILNLAEIAEGVASQSSLHNQALREFEARTSRVLSRALTTPPGSPAESDAYIIPAGATGVWAGKTNQISTFIGGAWSYYVPIEGCSSPWVNNEDKLVTFDGTNWVISGGASGGDVIGPASAVDGRLALFDGVSGKLIKAGSAPPTGVNTGDQSSITGNAGTATALQTARTIGGTAFDGTANITQPFDMFAFYPGVPTASVLVTRVPVARVITFPASLTGSYVKARVAATAQTDFDLQKNGVSVATIRFAAAGTVATFIAASSIVTAAGDLISIHAPASADATIADIGFCITGLR